MSKRLSLLVIVVTLFAMNGVGGCGGGGGGTTGVQSACNPDSFAPNYAHNLAHLLNWSSFPITVYFYQDSNYTTHRHDLAIAGFAEWSTASGGVLGFTEVSDVSKAVVTVHFDPTTQNGLTYLHFSDLTLTTADIYLGIKNQLDPDLQVVAAHEFGHTLGIDGHSSNTADLMYAIHYIGTPEFVTQNDINTVKTAYCHLFGRAACVRRDSRPGAPITTVVIQ